MGGKIARALVSPLSIIDKDLGRLALQAVAIGGQFIPGGGQIASAFATVALATLYKKKPGGGTSLSQLSRLGVSVQPDAPRPIVFGNTAMPVLVRYVEPSGTNQEYVDYIVCAAAHKVQSIDELWFEDRQAWTSGGGVLSPYTGSPNYLSVETITEAGSGAYHTVNGGTNWGSAQRLTGCATLKIRVKRSGNSKQAEGPLAQGLPSRVTIIGKGMPTYDPRQDSTNGGSGTQRPNDRTTWAYGTSGAKQGENPALQILSYLLGWTINGRLSVGKGVPAARLDLASFITAANVCDETVTLSATNGGGTQYRYQSHGVFSEADSPIAVLEALCTACNGTLRDANGKLRLDIVHNDLSSYVDFDDDDVLGAFTWEQTPSVEAFPNIIRGKFTDPSSNALYQMVDYPEVALTSIDGIDRIVTLDLPLVQNAPRAQRIAKQVLQRMQYPGVFRAEFGTRAWAVQVGSVVRLTFSTLGWTNKLFRVMEQTIQLSGVTAMTLREENSAIYAWSAEDTAPVTAASPTAYDQRNNPLAITAGNQIGVEDGATLNTPADELQRNPSFEAFNDDLRPIGWSGSLSGGDGAPFNGSVGTQTAWVEITSVARKGRALLRTRGYVEILGEPFPVIPGEALWAEASFQTYADDSLGTAPGSGRWYFGIRFMDQVDGSGSVNDFDYFVTDEPVTAASGWQDRVSKRTAPVNSRYGVLVCLFEYPDVPSNAEGMIDYFGVSRRQPAADVTIDQPVVQYLDETTGRAVSRRLLNQFFAGGAQQVYSTNPLSATTDGGGVATISIAAHDVVDDAGTVSMNSGTIGGLSASTGYYVYEDNPTFAGGARTYVATTSRSALANSGRRYVGYVATPAAGGSNTGNGGGRPGGDIP